MVVEKAHRNTGCRSLCQEFYQLIAQGIVLNNKIGDMQAVFCLRYFFEEGLKFGFAINKNIDIVVAQDRALPIYEV